MVTIVNYGTMELSVYGFPNTVRVYNYGTVYSYGIVVSLPPTMKYLEISDIDFQVPA